MNLFKTFTMLWWQASIFKLGLLAAGIAIGAYWSSFFHRYLALLVVIALIACIYITYIWWTQ